MCKGRQQRVLPALSEFLIIYFTPILRSHSRFQ
jgi:hypothetical protein